MAKNPKGSLVAVAEKEKVVGCVFCHRWGETGWLGPMVVDNAYQGRGIGRSLLNLATEYMVETECSVIGLETMPQTVGNVGLYLRNGYYPENLRIRLGKEIKPDPVSEQDSLIYCLDFSEAAPFFKDIRRISQEVDSMIDYSQEVKATYDFELGRCFFWKEYGEIQGFLLYHWVSSGARAVIKAMACQPGPSSVNRFGVFLDHCERVLAKEGIRQLILPVYGAHRKVIDSVLQRKYQILHVGVRMFYRKAEDNPELSDIIHLAQWSG
jgi:hypothetical protein